MLTILLTSSSSCCSPAADSATVAAAAAHRNQDHNDHPRNGRRAPYLRSSSISWPRFCRKLPSAPASPAITVIA